MRTLYLIAGIAIIPLVIWGIYAQVKVRRLFKKYSKQPVKKGITGSHLARTMLNSAGLNKVIIEEVDSSALDHYDPRQKAVRLSRGVARNASVTAVGIAAHEAAHAIQDGTGYEPVRLRNAAAPIVEKVSFILLPLLFLGIFVGGIITSTLFVNLSIICFLAIVLFYLITLPVELNASSRALRYIKDNGIADKKELEGIREILRAAALTYIIAAALAIVQFLRLLGMDKRRR